VRNPWPVLGHRLGSHSFVQAAKVRFAKCLTPLSRRSACLFLLAQVSPKRGEILKHRQDAKRRPGVRLSVPFPPRLFYPRSISARRRRSPSLTRRLSAPVTDCR
jgi:hypothetical protein